MRQEEEGRGGVCQEEEEVLLECMQVIAVTHLQRVSLALLY